MYAPNAMQLKNEFNIQKSPCVKRRQRPSHQNGIFYLGWYSDYRWDAWSLYLESFASVPFETRVMAFMDSLERAEEVVEQINIAYQRDGLLPLVFDTIVNPDIREN